MATESHVERIEHHENLPMRAFVHSVRSCAAHRHRDCELLFVLQGQIFVQAAQGETELRTDDLYFIHAGEMHLTHETTGPNLVAALQIDTDFAMRSDADFPRRRFSFNAIARRRKDDPRLRKVREIMAETLWEMRLRHPGYRSQVESLILRLITVLIREFDSELVALEPAKSADALSGRLERIVAYLEGHSSEELSSADIAATEGVSVSYLARLFKEQLGTTFGEYVNLLRTKKSLALLARRESTILDIALECGFPSIKSYEIAFKRVHNLTPSEWRRQQSGTPVAGIGESAYNRCNTSYAFSLLKSHLPASAAVV